MADLAVQSAPHDVADAEAVAGVRFPVVGIGASAGGIEASKRLFRALAPDTGMAFVLVQHLNPAHESLLSEILGRETSMPVDEIRDGMPLEANHIYVGPPGAMVSIEDGALRLEARDARAHDRSIDRFLTSLAAAQGHLAIGVVLSGSASDGTLGCEEIKSHGGITLAQDESAQHDSMPRSAIAAGCIDLIRAPEEIADEIARIARHPLVKRADREPSAEDVREGNFEALLGLIREGAGVDFSQYKRSTLFRRISRRLVLHRIENLDAYVKFARENPSEIGALFDDILINVTSFFRDPEIFETLKTEIFPKLLEDRPRHVPVRIWALGCSTGEEAYSLAIAFSEYAHQIGRPVNLQVFATDLSTRAIDKARAGIYPKTIAQDVSVDRLARFFLQSDGQYRISKTIRDMVVFARHNVLADPPFSHVDAITCRNLLIYLEPGLQQRLIPMLHYALRPGGYLVLGNSETIGAQRDLFEPSDPKHRIYRKRPAATRLPLGLSPMRTTAEGLPTQERQTPRPEPILGAEGQREADRLLLSRYAPAGVLINSQLEIIQFRGDTGSYLAPAPGKASLNILKMLREGLLVAVRGAVQKALREEIVVREENLWVKSNGGHRRVHVEVVPVKAATIRESCLLVLFEDAERAPAHRPPPPPVAEPPVEADADVTRLKQELSATREYLQSVIEQQEAANEELQSANEEVQSANEELQSINEELETSKEEVESTNEELATVNDELGERNRELTRSNNDLLNLLSSVQMAIVMLGPDLRICRFTPAAEKLLNLISSDIGRPIGDIKLNIDAPDLDPLVREVIDNVTPAHLEAQDRQGRWYSLRIRPYRTIDNRIDGAVLVLVDIDDLKKAQAALRTSEERFRLLADSAPVLIWVGGPDGKEFVNRAYLDFLGVDEAAVKARGWFNFVHPDDREGVVTAIDDATARQEGFDLIFRFRRADGEYRWVKSTGVPRVDASGRFLGHTGSKVDVTELKQAEQVLREADQSKNRFLAMLSHELRAPLTPLRNVVQLARDQALDEVGTRWTWSMIERQVQTITRMIDDLLDVSRITQGKIRLRREVVDLRDLLRNAVEMCSSLFRSGEQELVVDLPQSPLWIHADPLRLEQVFGNILSNAAKYTPAGGHVSVTARGGVSPGETGQVPMAELRVKDDGVGIEAALLPHIFEPFVQADRSLDRTSGGLGIGLALVQSLVQHHSGTVEAFSDGLGKGFEIVVRLPIHPEPPNATRRPMSATTREDAVLHRILLVDDHIDAGETMAMLLRAAGHDVRVATRGAEALEVAPEFNPSVVLLDIGLPGMDGYEVARRMREQFGQRPVLLVAISGYGQDEHRREARQAGFDHFFTKPVSIKTLREFLANPPSRGD